MKVHIFVNLFITRKLCSFGHYTLFQCNVYYDTYTSSDFLLFWFLLFMYLCTFFFWISVNKQNLNLNLMLKYCHTFHDRILTLNFLDILARSSLADEGYQQVHTNSCSRTSRKTRRGTNVWRSFLQIQHSCRISHETLRSLFSEWRLDPGEWGKSPLPLLIFLSQNPFGYAG